MKKFFTLLLTLPLFYICKINKAFSQSYQSQQTQIFAYNILLNGLIGGIGGAINKKDNEKRMLAFGKNFLKGSLGGLIKYTAKYETYYLGYNNKPYLAKPNRLLYYLGYSFVYNASLNRNLFHSYHCQFYGVNFEFEFKEKFHVNSRLSMLSTYFFIDFITRGYRLDLYKSLEYGLFFFDLKNNTVLRGIEISGTGGHNVIAIEQNNGYYNYNVIPHEFIHTYQKPDYFTISNFFSKPFKNIKSRKTYTILSKYVYLDIDYMQLIYWFQPKPIHYNNFYEFEAAHFSKRQYIAR